MSPIGNIFRRKLRSFLTIFGIAIGVMALVVMGSISERIQLLVDGGTTYYADKVTISGQTSMFGTSPITTDLIDDLMKVDGVAMASGSIASMIETDTAVMMGIPPMYNADDGRGADYETFEIVAAQGRLITNDDVGKAMLGADMAKKFEADVGDTITLRGKKFEVIGVTDKTLSAPDSAVTLALKDAQTLYLEDMPGSIRGIVEDPDKLITSITIYPEDGVDPEALAERIGDQFPDIMASGPELFTKQVEQPLQIFTTIIYAIAIVSLLVGSLSVINTMTMSVSERTREIGIRKAIGATDGKIMRQFVAESAVMGLLGGLLGAAIGWGIAEIGRIATTATGTNLFLVTPRLLISTLVFALVLGVISGLYPAWHASRMNPVAALRHE